MPARIDCEDIIRQQIGRDMNVQEIDEFFEQAKRLKKRAQASLNAANQGAAAKQAAQSWSTKEQLAAIAKKRAVELQLAKRYDAVSYALNNFRGMEGVGLEALLGGTKFLREGGRLSVDARGRALEGKYLGGFLVDLNSLGKEYFTILRKGAMDRDISEAMFTIDNPNASPYKGPKEAMKISEVMHRWQEIARMGENRAGAWIAKEPGYIVRQSHDPAKLKKSGYLKWRDNIQDRLDWARTAEGEFDPKVDAQAADDFLRAVYNDIITGVHLRVDDKNTSPLTRGSVMGSTAAKVSKERVLRFKSGGDWFDYNKIYGTGNLRDAFLRGLTKAAKTTALMDVFGPSPQTNLDNMIRDIEQSLARRGDDKGIKRLRNKRGKLNNLMKEVDGTLNIEGNATLAGVGRIVRNLQSLAKLGGAVISSVSDIPNYMYEFAYQGSPLLKTMGDSLKLFIQGRGTLEQQRILSQCGVFFDSMTGNISARFWNDELPGKMTRMMNLFFRMNGLSWWTESWKKAATLMMSHELAQLKNTGWSGLNKARQRVLSLYGIDEGRWDMLRKGKTLAADGRDYLTPEAAFDVSDAAIEAYLRSQGKRVSPARLDEFREELADQLRTYFRDRVQYAVLEPDAQTGALWHQGTSAGTPVGEALRYISQFKSFPTVFLQRTAAREIFGRGTDTFWRGFGEGVIPHYLKNQYGEAGHFAGVFLMMTVFGYGAMTVKQLLAGKTPHDPRKFKTVIAAASQGGGLGIYGDFLFGERSRMGSRFLSTLAGPTGGSLDSLYNLGLDLRDGVDVKSNAFRFFFNQMPGNNLFWFRAAFDHLIAYRLYESLNPGYIRRMQRRVEKENGQTFWWKP